MSVQLALGVGGGVIGSVVPGIGTQAGYLFGSAVGEHCGHLARSAAFVTTS